MKRHISLIAGFALLSALTASCEKKQQASTEKPPLVQGVQVGRVAAATLDDFYEATGTVKSRTTVVVSANVLGRITTLRVREGDRVRVGQTLVEIDNRDAAAQLQKAQAGLREAEQSLAEVELSISAAQSTKMAADANKQLAAATFDRYQALLERKSISPQEFDEVKAKRDIAGAEAERAEKMLQTLAAKKNQVTARIDHAKAEITSAQVNLGYARLTAPINGVVVSKQAETGATATPGAPLLVIDDSSRYRLETAVEESQSGRLRLGAPVSVTIEAIGAVDLNGKVAEIVPAADPASRSFTVKIDLPPQQMIRSGLFGKARFAAGQRQAIAIPTKAIVERGQLIGVFVVDGNGVARLRLVKTGKAFGDQFEVLSGLNDGERIVVDGVAQVNDGNRVQ